METYATELPKYTIQWHPILWQQALEKEEPLTARYKNKLLLLEIIKGDICSFVVFYLHHYHMVNSLAK